MVYDEIHIFLWSWNVLLAKNTNSNDSSKTDKYEVTGSSDGDELWSVYTWHCSFCRVVDVHWLNMGFALFLLVNKHFFFPLLSYYIELLKIYYLKRYVVEQHNVILFCFFKLTLFDFLTLFNCLTLFDCLTLCDCLSRDLKQEIEMLNAGKYDDKLDEMWDKLQA
mgnify:CR=1 FL=1